MSSRSIGSSLGLLLLVGLPGCGDGGTGVRPGESPDGEVLKISYYRVNPDPKTKRPDPTFRVVMSESWRQVLGEGPRDPLAKAAPNKVFKGFANDPVMARYVRELRSLGLDRLRSKNADDCNPADIHQRAMSPVDREHPRIMTVGTEKGARSYTFGEQLSEELSETFIKCEVLVSRIMDGHTLMVKIEQPRAVVPSEKKP